MNQRDESTKFSTTPPPIGRRNLLLAAGIAAASAAWMPLVALADDAKPKGDGADSKAEQDVLALSKAKWVWMADRKADELDKLFHEKVVFVHMGGNMTRAHELEIIKSGSIQYKKADIQESSARLISGTTAIVLSKIKLLAVVGGNEVTNPFMVTEVYVREGEVWKLAQLSFSRTLGQ